MVHSVGKNDHWNTPPDLWIRGLRFFGVFCFDFDPCSNDGSTVPACQRWTIADDGLAQTWAGVAWCNPPYSRIGPWARRGFETWRRGETESIWIVPNATGTNYWHRYYWRAPFLCFIHGRVAFVDHAGVPRAGSKHESAIVAFTRDDDDHARRFAECFGDLGKVVRT